MISIYIVMLLCVFNNCIKGQVTEFHTNSNTSPGSIWTLNLHKPTFIFQTVSCDMVTIRLATTMFPIPMAILDIKIKSNQVSFVNVTNAMSLEIYDLPDISESLIDCNTRRTMWIYYKNGIIEFGIGGIPGLNNLLFHKMENKKLYEMTFFSEKDAQWWIDEKVVINTFFKTNGHESNTSLVRKVRDFVFIKAMAKSDMKITLQFNDSSYDIFLAPLNQQKKIEVKSTDCNLSVKQCLLQTSKVDDNLGHSFFQMYWLFWDISILKIGRGSIYDVNEIAKFNLSSLSSEAGVKVDTINGVKGIFIFTDDDVGSVSYTLPPPRYRGNPIHFKSFMVPSNDQPHLYFRIRTCQTVYIYLSIFGGHFLPFKDYGFLSISSKHVVKLVDHVTRETLISTHIKGSFSCTMSVPLYLSWDSQNVTRFGRNRLKDVGTLLQYKFPAPITRITIASLDPNASVHFTGISGERLEIRDAPTFHRSVENEQFVIMKRSCRVPFVNLKIIFQKILNDQSDQLILTITNKNNTNDWFHIQIDKKCSESHIECGHLTSSKGSLFVQGNMYSCSHRNEYYMKWNATHFTFNTFSEALNYLSDYKYMIINSNQMDFELSFQPINYARKHLSENPMDIHLKKYQTNYRLKLKNSANKNFFVTLRGTKLNCQIQFTEYSIELAIYVNGHKVAGKLNNIYANELNENVGNVWKEVYFNWKNDALFVSVNDIPSLTYIYNRYGNELYSLDFHTINLQSSHYSNKTNNKNIMHIEMDKIVGVSTIGHSEYILNRQGLAFLQSDECEIHLQFRCFQNIYEINIADKIITFSKDAVEIFKDKIECDHILWIKWTIREIEMGIVKSLNYENIDLSNTIIHIQTNKSKVNTLDMHSYSRYSIQWAFLDQRFVFHSILSMGPWQLKLMNLTSTDENRKTRIIQSKCRNKTIIILSVLLAIVCILFIVGSVLYFKQVRRRWKDHEGFNLRRLSNSMQSVTSNG